MSLDTKVVYVNSRNRDIGGTPQNFAITDTENNFAQIPQSVKAVTICIPFTWYNVTSANNTFTFTGTLSGGPLSFVVPPNNYTGSSLATKLQSLLISTAVAGGPHNYTVTYDVSTGKFTFNVTTEAFSIDFTVPNNMSNILGFNSVVLPTANTQISSNVANLIIDTEIWVTTNLISGCDNGVVPWLNTNPSANTQGILACFPIQGCFGDIINYTLPPQFPFFNITNSEFSKTKTIEPRKMTFTLKFPSGAPLDLNGHDWSIQILFDMNHR